MGLVVGLSPRTALAAQIGPEMERVAQPIVAGVTHDVLGHLARLDRNRRGASIALQGSGVFETATITADLGPGKEPKSF